VSVTTANRPTAVRSQPGALGGNENHWWQQEQLAGLTGKGEASTAVPASSLPLVRPAAAPRRRRERDRPTGAGVRFPIIGALEEGREPSFDLASTTPCPTEEGARRGSTDRDRDPGSFSAY
jgi:hypothetical protein